MTMKHVLEPAKRIKILDRTEVVVAGGGPAGLGAAIAASREGAKVLLIERYGCLGGMATVGLVGPFMSTIGTEGVFQEFLNRMAELGGVRGYAFDPEAFKYIADKMIKEAGVKVLLHTLAVAPIMRGKNLTGLFLETKSGRRAIVSKVTIDATGDGDMAATAGAPYGFGREKDRLTQSSTLVFRVGGITSSHVNRKLLNKKFQYSKRNGEISIPQEHLALPEKGSTVRKGEGSVNWTRIPKVNGTDPLDLTRAEIEGRRQVWEAIKFYRKYIPSLKNCYLIDTASEIGVRESRRIIGDYILTEQDIIKTRKFKDTIAKCSYPIDIHSPTGPGLRWVPLKPGTWYEIPYRCLLPRYVEYLIVAGRCISSTHEAQSSLRIIPTCFATGQAAGVAASLSVRDGVPPRKVDITKLQTMLNRQRKS